MARVTGFQFLGLPVNHPLRLEIIGLGLNFAYFYHCFIYFSNYSFCNLTVEFGVQVHGARSAMQEIPTFVVLGSACLTIVTLLVSGYYTFVMCSD